MKGKVQSPLISSTRILQSKYHHNPLKETNKPETYEGRFGHVLFGHKNLIVAGVTVKKTDNPMSRNIIN